MQQHTQAGGLLPFIPSLRPISIFHILWVYGFNNLGYIPLVTLPSSLSAPFLPLNHVLRGLLLSARRFSLCAPFLISFPSLFFQHPCRFLLHFSTHKSSRPIFPSVFYYCCSILFFPTLCFSISFIPCILYNQHRIDLLHKDFPGVPASSIDSCAPCIRLFAYLSFSSPVIHLSIPCPLDLTPLPPCSLLHALSPS